MSQIAYRRGDKVAVMLQTPPNVPNPVNPGGEGKDLEVLPKPVEQTQTRGCCFYSSVFVNQCTMSLSPEEAQVLQ